MKDVMMTMINIIISIIIFLLGLSLWGFYNVIRPTKIRSNVTPEAYGLAYESISFSTKDHVLIHGWFIPSPFPQAKTIILLHGYPADKGDILPSRIFLHPNYHLLFIDFRYLGQSSGSHSTVGRDEILDVLAAIDYLDKKGIHEVGVWGLSMGGAIALMAAAETSKIKAVVVESAYAQLSWMANDHYRIPLLKYPLTQLTRCWAWLFLRYDIQAVSPAKSAEKLKMPILLIYSKQDNVVPFKHGLLLQESLRHNPQAQFIFVEDVAHGESIKDGQKIVKEFFDKNL